MAEEQIELRECPHCGGPAELYEEEDGTGWSGRCAELCFQRETRPESAIAAWNRRAERPTITLERAVEVLNERKHSGYANWSWDEKLESFVAGDSMGAAWLDDFEGIAVAEKYLGGEQPLVEKLRELVARRNAAKTEAEYDDAVAELEALLPAPEEK